MAPTNILLFFGSWVFGRIIISIVGLREDVRGIEKPI